MKKPKNKNQLTEEELLLKRANRTRLKKINKVKHENDVKEMKVVIDGKEKNINITSKYLLDMMIPEDEE